MAHWNRMPPPLAEYQKCRVVGDVIIDEKGGPNGWTSSVSRAHRRRRSSAAWPIAAHLSVRGLSVQELRES
jgi:hypothetical protein